MRSLPLLPLALTLCGCAALCPSGQDVPAVKCPAAEPPRPAAEVSEAVPAAEVTPAAEAVPMQPLVGAYSDFAVLKPEQRDVFIAATKGTEAASYTPNAVATQVVNGTNYNFRCLSEDGRHRYSVIIHQPLPQTGEPPRILSITEIPLEP